MKSIVFYPTFDLQSLIAYSSIVFAIAMGQGIFIPWPDFYTDKLTIYIYGDIAPTSGTIEGLAPFFINTFHLPRFEYFYRAEL